FFLLMALGSAFNFVAIWGAVESYRTVLNPSEPGTGETQPHTQDEARSLLEVMAGPGAESGEIRRLENGIMIRMALINALNGVAIGLTGPLLVYWFNVKFGVGPGALGPVFALTYIVTGLASVWTGKLTERMG